MLRPLVDLYAVESVVQGVDDDDDVHELGLELGASVLVPVLAPEDNHVVISDVLDLNVVPSLRGGEDARGHVEHHLLGGVSEVGQVLGLVL